MNLRDQITLQAAAEPQGQFGGRGPFTLPKDHEAGMVVPKGGSCCAKCEYLKDPKHCGNSFWVKWNGGINRLPAPADEYCCDWYEREEKK